MVKYLMLLGFLMAMAGCSADESYMKSHLQSIYGDSCVVAVDPSNSDVYFVQMPSGKILMVDTYPSASTDYIKRTYVFFKAVK